MTEIPTSYLPPFPVALGEPIRIYRQSPGSRLGFIIRLLIWAAVIVVCINLLYRWFFVTPPNELISVVLAAAAMYFVSGLVVPAMYAYLKQWNDVAVEYTQGIAYRRDFEWWALRRDEIGSVTRTKSSVPWGFLQDDSGLGCLLLLVALAVGQTGQYAIVGKDGVEISIGATLDDIDELVEKIATAAQRTTGALQPTREPRRRRHRWVRR